MTVFPKTVLPKTESATTASTETSPLIVLDPTDERLPANRPRAPRLESIAGRRIALLDISKARGDIFLDRLAERLIERGAAIERRRKTTFSRLAPADLRQEISTRCDAVIEALAD